MPRVWELLSYLRGEGDQPSQPDSKLRQMREASLPVDPASRRELDDLVATVGVQKKEIAQLTDELAGYRAREQEAAARLTSQLAECDRLRAELTQARADLQQRDQQLQERDQQLLERDHQLQERDQQLQLSTQQLRARQAKVEDAQLELNQKTAELSRTAQQLAKLEGTAEEARGEVARLSQQTADQNKQIVHLETQLRTAKLAVAAAAAAPPPPPPPPPPTIDPAEVEALRTELATVRESLRVSETQRMQEIRMIQEALDEALKENADLEASYRREVEQLKTVTAERETQLMEDAEARLREMQRDWKRRLEEREKAAEERAKIARQSIEDELESLRSQRRDIDMVGGEQKVTEVELLRSFEAEVVQLRGLSHELMRELRAGNRQVEVAKMAEAMAADENRRLNELVRKQNGTISSIQKELQRVQEQTDSREESRATLSAQWEDRLRQERSALKAELDALHSEEKHLAVESVRVQLEQQLQTAKQDQEQTVRKLEQELAAARDEVIQKDESHYFEIKRIQKQAKNDLSVLQEKLQHAFESSKPEPIVQQNAKDPSPVVNGRGSETDEDEDEEEEEEEDEEEGDEEAEEEDFFDVEDSEAAGEEIRRQHRRDLEVLLRTSQDQRADLQRMLERYEARTACTQEELRMLHAERSGPHSEAGPARRPVPGAARLAAVLTALQECGDHLVRLIAARDEQRLRSVRVLVPARLRQLNGRGAP
ncbi:trichohyalin-like isoform X1 [Amphibalanus amphitrite]|uniref:trichohyalin-like isoform X1 n=1 Tax=Amphibalanus amphitrite TaxID=1232801 RepID=UPI001C919ED2|nr:trichohyalin-like isoform X1 [Amphibalanus amphitrite]